MEQGYRQVQHIPYRYHQSRYTQPEQTYGIPEHPLQNHKINYNGYLSRMVCIFFPTVSKSRISRVRETLTHSNQNKQKHPNGCFYIFLGARIRQSEAHDQYADEQLATAQKRIFLIEFLPSGWLLFIQCQILMVSVWF